MHICIILAISCLEAPFSSLFSFSGRFFYEDHLSQQVFRTPGMLLSPLTPSKKRLKQMDFQHFSFGPTKPMHICIILAISCLEADLFFLFFSIVLQLLRPKPAPTRGHRDSSKSISERIVFQHFRCMASPSPNIHASYLPSHV